MEQRLLKLPLPTGRAPRDGFGASGYTRRVASADSGLLDRLAAVLREGPSLRLALLFGSAARDGLRPDSDLDIGILPSDPKMPLHTELDLQSRLERVAGCPVDLVRLDRASTVLKWQAARDGIPLVMRSRADLVRFVAEAALEHCDLAATRLQAERTFHQRLVGMSGTTLPRTALE